MDSVITTQRIVPPAPNKSVPGTKQQAGNIQPADGKDLPPAPDLKSVESAVKQINSYLTDSQRALNFQVHEASGRTIVRVVNPETDEVIRQIPSEEVLNLAAAIQSQGLQLINELA